MDPKRRLRFGAHVLSLTIERRKHMTIKKVTKKMAVTCKCKSSC